MEMHCPKQAKIGKIYQMFLHKVDKNPINVCQKNNSRHILFMNNEEGCCLTWVQDKNGKNPLYLLLFKGGDGMSNTCDELTLPWIRVGAFYWL